MAGTPDRTVDLEGSISLDGSDIELGAVEIKDGTSDTRAKVGTGSSIVVGDSAVAVRDAGLNAAIKQEDAPHVSGDSGIPMWAVRNDTGATLASNDNDYIPLGLGVDGGIYLTAAGAIRPTSPCRAEDTGLGTGHGMLVVGGQRNDADAVQTSATADAGYLIQTALGHLIVTERGSYSHITANTTTTIKTGIGILKKIVVNTKGASSNIATVYDNTTGTGTVIAVIDTTSEIGAMEYDLAFTTGLTIVTATGTPADLTVVYS